MSAPKEFYVDGIATKHFKTNPERPTLVFLHDSLGCIPLWKDFPEKLGQLTDCNVIIYDRIGYGKSQPFSNPKRDNFYIEKEADILNQLLEKWNVKDAILFGHSDGGSIALITAAKYPDRISGIITEGAHIFVEEITLQGIREAIQLYETTDLKSRLEKYHGTNTEEMFWAWAGTWTTNTFQNWSIENILHNIKCPALIIQGEDDEYGSLEQVEGILKGIGKQSEKLIIPKIKHTPHKEIPELILSKSALFIKKITE